MTSNTVTAVESIGTGERADLLAELRQARHFLRFTARELTDDQARTRSTASALTIGGLIKHVTQVEQGWTTFIVAGKEAMGGDFSDMTEEDYAEREQGFQMRADETLAELLQEYEKVADETDALLESLPSLDARQELPKAPWYSEESQSARRTFLHIVAETTQHAGHADIIRETLDGAKSMG